MADSNGYLLGFEDGPLATATNVDSLAGPSLGRLVVARDLFGWPLPQTLRVLTHPGSPAAIWNPEDPPEDLPGSVLDSLNAVTYTKISESQAGEWADGPESRVMRGAAYRLAREEDDVHHPDAAPRG